MKNIFSLKQVFVQGVVFLKCTLIKKYAFVQKKDSLVMLLDMEEFMQEYINIFNMQDLLFFYKEKIYLNGELFKIMDSHCGKCFFNGTNCAKLRYTCVDYNEKYSYIFNNIKYVSV